MIIMLKSLLPLKSPDEMFAHVFQDYLALKTLCWNGCMSELSNRIA
jgi:hypothetical protein